MSTNPYCECGADIQKVGGVCFNCLGEIEQKDRVIEMLANDILKTRKYYNIPTDEKLTAKMLIDAAMDLTAKPEKELEE